MSLIKHKGVFPRDERALLSTYTLSCFVINVYILDQFEHQCLLLAPWPAYRQARGPSEQNLNLVGLERLKRVSGRRLKVQSFA